MTGSGKSTVARKIAERYGLRYICGGDALKELAIELGYDVRKVGWWESEEGRKFLQLRTKNPMFDKKVDEKLLKWIERGNVVVDSWTIPWLFKGGFKIWLEASPEVRAKRLAKRDNINFTQALQILKEKDEKSKNIYRKIYGFNFGEDLSPFDLVLDVNLLNIDEVFDAICLVIDNSLLNSKKRKIF